ncbi:MAG: hypothetical protein Q8Q45_00780, partial [Methylococcaceae bacterium]|nr:hypothetical protein [Methylococcaceae bacterium]
VHALRLRSGERSTSSPRTETIDLYNAVRIYALWVLSLSKCRVFRGTQLLLLICLTYYYL